MSYTDRHVKQLERMLEFRQKKIDEYDANSYVVSEYNALKWALECLVEPTLAFDQRLHRVSNEVYAFITGLGFRPQMLNGFVYAFERKQQGGGGDILCPETVEELYKSINKEENGER